MQVVSRIFQMIRRYFGDGMGNMGVSEILCALRDAGSIWGWQVIVEVLVKGSVGDTSR